MKVYIGPYTRWLGPYQVADRLQKLGLSDDLCDKIGDWLDDNTPLTKVCMWFNDRQKRKVQVQIDEYDTWNVDSTLTYIIQPLLIKFKEDETGGCFVDDEDAPEALRSINADEPGTDCSWDSNSRERWLWLIDELIWTFTQLHDDTDWEAQYYKECPDDNGSKIGNFDIDHEGMKNHEDRISNGLRLFGKYYRGLWT